MRLRGMISEREVEPLRPNPFLLFSPAETFFRFPFDRALSFL
jgi:hypothetical protein